jgi:hypothetical protein
MDLPAVHRHVDENFLLADDIDFDLRGAAFPSNVWASTEDGSFLERKLKTTQNGSMNTVRADCRMHYDAIARAIAILGSVDSERYRILGEVA